MTHNSSEMRSPGEHSSNSNVISPSRQMKCGLCCWRPQWLQVGYNWKLGLALMCWFSFLHGMVSNGLNGVNSTALERRFDVDNQMIGWFSAANRFSIASTTIVSSYYADRTYKPRTLAIAGGCYVIGSIIMALPHFILPPYATNEQEYAPMCYDRMTLFDNFGDSANGSNSSNWLDPSKPGDCSGVVKKSVSRYFGMLIAGNVVLGIGGGMIWTVGLAFIDDFSTTSASSFNVGVAYLFNSFGTAVGFGAGSAMLTLDVNFNNANAPKANLLDANFVGAWWLGYLICGVIFVTVALGFACFDRELPETARLRPDKLAHAQTHVSKIDVNVEGAQLALRSKFISVLAIFIDNIVRLLTNPVVVCLAVATILSNTVTDGLQPFIVKMMRTQFGVSETTAGIALAVLIVVGIASGCFLSGLMAYRLNMSVRSLLLVTIAFSSLAVILSLSQLLSCSKEKLAGVTIDYNQTAYLTSFKNFNSSQLVESCNIECGCLPQFYEPVCYAPSGLAFYSACYAGCTGFDAKTFTYTDCSCIPSLHGLKTNVTSAQYGACESSCDAMYLALVGLFLILFCGFFVIVPLTEVMMRTVPLGERSFALSFNQSVGSFLGSIPGPIILGVIFDQACLLRRPTPWCSSSEQAKQGACIVYDSDNLSWWLAGILGVLDLLAIVFYAIAFVLYKPPSGETLGEYFRSLGHWWRRTCRSQCSANKSTRSSTTTDATFGDSIARASYQPSVIGTDLTKY